MTQFGEPAFDKREQLEQIRSGLMDGEQIYAVYDATGAGTGFIAATDKRVILQDKSFAGKKVALVSLPYSRITSVAVTSNKSLMGHFFSSSSIAVSAGTTTHEVEFRGQEKAHHMHNLILWHHEVDSPTGPLGDCMAIRPRLRPAAGDGALPAEAGSAAARTAAGADVYADRRQEFSSGAVAMRYEPRR